MGLLDEVVGGLMNNSGGGGSPMQGVLMGLLGGQGSQGGLSGMGAAGAGQSTPMQGGLGGIISAFEQAGLGHIVQSWVGNGQNLPVSPQQLQGVLGDDKVQAMASQAGLPKEDFLSQLAQHLPNAVSGMTPNGVLPAGTAQV